MLCYQDNRGNMLTAQNASNNKCVAAVSRKLFRGTGHVRLWRSAAGRRSRRSQTVIQRSNHVTSPGMPLANSHNHVERQRQLENRSAVYEGMNLNVG